ALVCGLSSLMGFSEARAGAGAPTRSPPRRAAKEAATAAAPPKPSAPSARRCRSFLRGAGRTALRDQAAQHPGCFFVDLHALGQKVTGGLVVGRLGHLEHLARGARRRLVP